MSIENRPPNPESRLSQMQRMRNSEDPLNEYRFGAHFCSAPSEQLNQQPEQLNQERFEALLNRLNNGTFERQTLDQQIAQLAPYFSGNGNGNPEWQRTLLPHVDALIRRHGFHWSESAAQDFNDRLWQAGARTLQLIPNPNIQGPGDNLWYLRVRNPLANSNGREQLHPVP